MYRYVKACWNWRVAQTQTLKLKLKNIWTFLTSSLHFGKDVTSQNLKTETKNEQNTPWEWEFIISPNLLFHSHKYKEFVFLCRKADIFLIEGASSPLQSVVAGHVQAVGAVSDPTDTLRGSFAWPSGAEGVHRFLTGILLELERTADILQINSH